MAKKKNLGFPISEKYHDEHLSKPNQKSNTTSLSFDQTTFKTTKTDFCRKWFCKKCMKIIIVFSFAKITLKIVNIYNISYISRKNVYIWHVDLLLAISFNDLYLSKIHIIHVGVFFLSLAKFQNWWYLVPGIYSITFHSWLSSTLQHDLFLKVWLPIFLQYLQMFMIKCISYVIWKKNF